MRVPPPPQLKKEKEKESALGLGQDRSKPIRAAIGPRGAVTSRAVQEGSLDWGLRWVGGGERERERERNAAWLVDAWKEHGDQAATVHAPAANDRPTLLRTALVGREQCTTGQDWTVQCMWQASESESLRRVQQATT